jgi:protoheme IX farnesyltransferase
VTTGGATTGLAPAAGLGTQREAKATDYWELMKPRIMLLIVVTTVGSLALAAEGWPGTALTAWTVLGMALVSGGSSALNHWYDRDIDALMERTSARPVASGRVAPRAALGLGLVLATAGVALLALQVHWLAAVWAFAGFACYVLVYTVWLKRRTPQNIVIGGAAGAVPPLVAWAAVQGSVSATAVALFAIVFLWTPPHFWALALLVVAMALDPILL